MNRFLYAEGNPWSMVDPSGHASYYEGSGCGPGGKYCGSTGNDQNFHKNVKKVVAKAHNDYIHHVRARMYDPEATPTISSEWASGDTWGESMSIGSASATETASQAAATHCISTRGGQSCQSAQQQADGAATVAGIGDAFGDIWNGVMHLGSCAGNIVNCADVGLGLGMMAINPIGTGQAIGTQRAADINSGDKRKGAHAITSTVVDAFGLALAPLGLGEASEVAQASEVLDAADQVRLAAQTVAARGRVALTDPQSAAVAKNPNLAKAFQGYNFHQLVARLLGDDFTYSYRGVDFTQVGTESQVELTTPGQVGKHLRTYPHLTPDQIVTYEIP